MVLNSNIAKWLKLFYPEYSSLKDGQGEILDAVFNGGNVLGIMPTGSGKSLCYQFPALLNAKQEQMTIIISPLIALMKDQYNRINGKGINVSFLNSTMSYNQQKLVLQNITKGEILILFIAPERLRDGLFVAAMERAGKKVSLCIIDEAHCISEWGHDFRGDYLYISEFLKKQGNPQVIALTATATGPVKEEIVSELNIDNVFDNFPIHRNNLKLEVKEFSSKQEKYQYIESQLEILEKPGIIYTAGRDQAEELADFIQMHGVKADYFHAVRKNAEKEKVFGRFMNGDIDVICATKAFGMGIDKDNIRFVIHYQMPESIDSYCQEIGRGGRDNQACRCILLYSSRDSSIHKKNIKEAYPDSKTIKKEYSETLYLGPLRRRERKERDIPIGKFYDEKAAILLRYFEQVGLLVRQGEILSSLDVEIIENKTKAWTELINAIKSNIKGTKGTVDVSMLADSIALDPVEVMKHLYGAAVDRVIDIGSREFRDIRYVKLRNDIEVSDLQKIEAEMSIRRVFKLERLEKMVSYAKNTTECRAQSMSKYFNKEQYPCGICDICLKK